MVEPCVSLASLLTAHGEVLPPAAAETTQTMLMRLDPVQRAKVMMALLGLVLVGGMLIVMVFFAGRQLRRIARKRPAPTPQRDNDWYRKPLIPPEPTTGQVHDSE